MRREEGARERAKDKEGKEGKGIGVEERRRGRKRGQEAERWSRRGKFVERRPPQELSPPDSRKEDRVIYNDTRALRLTAAIGVMYVGIRFNGIRSASIVDTIYNGAAPVTNAAEFSTKARKPSEDSPFADPASPHSSCSASE